MQFAVVVSDKRTRQIGIEKGDIVMVIGLDRAQITASDPYLERVFARVVRYVDGQVQIPNETENDYVAYMLDPRNLEWVGDEMQSEFEKRLSEQYS